MDEEKIAYTSWKCKSCTMNNSKYMSYCEACLQPRDERLNTTIHETIAVEQSRHCDQNWKCTSCSMNNSQYISYCEACLKSKGHQQKTANNTMVVAKTASDKNWKCKLCSTKNNKYITYCEMCLVPRKVQKDDKLLNELQATLNSSLCHKYVKADEIRGMVQKLHDDVQRLTMHRTDKQFVNEIKQEIDTLYAKMNIKCDGNIVHDFIERYNMDNYSFKKQRESNKKCHPVCKCGQEMKSIKATKCYGSHISSAICNICDERIPSNDTLFHCQLKQIKNIHPQGFHICLKCQQTYIHRLRYFVAIIICPTMTKNHIGKDAETLRVRFKKLGFHKVICLEGDQVKKKTVEDTLNKILPKKNKNVNQFTAICYSGHGELDEDGKYSFAIDPNDRTTWISSDIIKNQFNASKCSALIDGFKQYFNNFWRNRYYRHNTLLLVNSCHSGGLHGSVNSQNIADSLGTARTSALLLSVFQLTSSDLDSALTAVRTQLAKPSLDCIKRCFIGDIPWEAMVQRFGISAEHLALISMITRISLIVVVIVAISVYKAIEKSMECESIYVIASCHKKQESNACYGISPFIKHCNDFFHTFLNAEQNNRLRNNLMDSPRKLFEYLKAKYTEFDANLGGMSLNKIDQYVCQSNRGFNQFAMCPLLNRN